MQKIIYLKLSVKAMLQVPEVFNKDLQTLYSRFFGILINYSLQLSRIPLGKNIILIFQSFKIVTYSFIQFIKGNTKGITFKVSVVVVKYQAAQYGRVGLAKLLFRNISLLAKVYKNSQFKVKVIIFTAILRFVGIKLSQVSQLLTIGLYLGSLQIYNLNNKRGLVRNLIYGGITVRSVVHNLGVGYILASKVNSKAAQVYRANLVKWVRYKASNPIKFGRSKEFFSSFDLVQDFLFSLFCLVLFT